MSIINLTKVRVIDPSQQPQDYSASLSINNGLIESALNKKAEQTFEQDNLFLVPAAIDLYANIKDVTKDAAKAKAAGIQSVCMAPDTQPVIDTPADVTLINEKNQDANGCKILPLGALTQGLKGEQLANMYSLQQAGCIALSNSKKPIPNLLVLRRLMEYAATHQMLIYLTPLQADLAKDGVMHEGAVATRMGMTGIPETAETIAIAQYLLLAEHTGARIHLSQISCARSVALIREAKNKGIEVSADVAIANLLYTDRDVIGYRSLYHLTPPLRAERDRQALLKAVNDGELAVCSNHKATAAAAKTDTFAAAPVGMKTLDSWLSMGLQLVAKGELELNSFIFASSTLPGQILGIETSLTANNSAMNLVELDLNAEQASYKLLEQFNY